MKAINYRPTCGENIRHAIRYSTSLARMSGQRVRFQFNDVVLEATPKKSPATLLWEWNLTVGRAVDSYRMSRKGQAETLRRATETARNQDAVTAAIRSLPGLLENNNLDHLMGWLHSFTHCADDVGVDLTEAAGLKGGGHEWIALLFESKGYREDQHVGQPPDWFTTRERMGRYIVGQAMACLRQGMPPHPIIQSFIAKYYALPTTL